MGGFSMAKVFAIIFQTIFVAGGILDPEQAQIIETITDEVLSLTIVISILTFSLAVPMLMRTIHRKIEASRHSALLDLLLKISERAVLSAEQTVPSGNNALKYDYASKILVDAAKSYGIKNMTQEDCRVFIESSVYTLKQSQEKHF